MISLDAYAGPEVIAKHVESVSGERHAASDGLIPKAIFTSSSERQHLSNDDPPQPSSSESDSGDGVDDSFLPNNATTRDIIRRLKEQDPEQAAFSSWTIPKRSRPFNSISKPFTCSMAALGDFVAANIPFRLRLDSLFYRCRLLVFQESLHMVEKIQAIEHKTDHSRIFVDGLCAQTVDQAQTVIKDIDLLVTECRSKNLKRLEVEFRLIQIAIHAVLRSLNTTSGIDVQTSANIAIGLCQEYPDTAGIFYTDCLSVKNTIEKKRNDWKMDLYKLSANKFWKLWAGHEIGCLRHCLYGHPYSGYTFFNCPECGRKEEPRATVDYSKYLDEKAFLDKMQDKKLATFPTETKKAHSPPVEEDMITIRSIEEATSQQGEEGAVVMSETPDLLGDNLNTWFWEEPRETSQQSLQLISQW